MTPRTQTVLTLASAILVLVPLHAGAQRPPVQQQPATPAAIQGLAIPRTDGTPPPTTGTHDTATTPATATSTAPTTAPQDIRSESTIEVEVNGQAVRKSVVCTPQTAGAPGTQPSTTSVHQTLTVTLETTNGTSEAPVLEASCTTNGQAGTPDAEPKTARFVVHNLRLVSPLPAAPTP